MKTIDKNVMNLSRKPFALLALIGIFGFGFDLALHSAGSSAEEAKLFGAMMNGRILSVEAVAATPEESADRQPKASNERDISSPNTEARARLLFKKNESSIFPARHWVDELNRFRSLAK